MQGYCAWLTTCLFILVGCAADYESASNVGEALKQSGSKSPGDAFDSAATPATNADGGEQTNAVTGEVVQPDHPQPTKRRVIYNATIDVIVADFSKTAPQIRQLVQRFDGYVAGSSIIGDSGSNRTGQWTIRVPVDQYDDFVDAATKLGELTRLTTTSKEVTAEFYDVQARLRNKEHEESRLLKILETRGGKLQDILTVEKEISRVRSEVEQLQGRMRVLKDVTALSTVTLSIREVEPFVAAVPENFPSFGDRVATAWQNTLDSLVATREWIVIAFVSKGPWIVILLLPSFLVYRVGRKIVRQARKPQAV